MLSGVVPSVVAQLEKTGLIRKIGRENIFPDSEQIGESVMAAWDAAEKWVAEQPPRPVKEPQMIAPTTE
jgi:hypothetical protein